MNAWEDLQGDLTPIPLLARYPGTCVACRAAFPSGTPIAHRLDGWSHARCPRSKSLRPRPNCYLCGEPVSRHNEYHSPRGTTAHLAGVTSKPRASQGNLTANGFEKGRQ